MQWNIDITLASIACLVLYPWVSIIKQQHCPKLLITQHTVRIITKLWTAVHVLRNRFTHKKLKKYRLEYCDISHFYFKNTVLNINTFFLIFVHKNIIPDLSVKSIFIEGKRHESWLQVHPTNTCAHLRVLPRSAGQLCLLMAEEGPISLHLQALPQLWPCMFREVL